MKLMKNTLMLLIVSQLFACSVTTDSPGLAPKVLKALIVDGQNNHDVWPLATSLMQQYLEASGKFEVDVYRSRYTWQGEKWLSEFPLQDGKTYEAVQEPQIDEGSSPNFGEYDVVIFNFGWRASPWPKSTQQAFEDYMQQGGGLVSIHAANNSFPQWLEYNKMIGLGGWGNRNEKSGPYVYFDEHNQQVADTSVGNAGGHGKQHEFVIQTRNFTHPIMQNLPASWLHSQDELYNRLRGPATNLTVLATAFDDPQYNGSGRHEPVLMTIDYHQGRVFHSTLGHGPEALKSQSFIVTFLRGTEWAATGKVSSTLVPSFP